MHRTALHDHVPLADLSALSIAIMASPSIRGLITPRFPDTSGMPDMAIGIPCGEIIAAIYDLLEDTPLAPHASGIVDAVLRRTTAFAGIQTRRH